jgi:hypothetical protein
MIEVYLFSVQRDHCESGCTPFMHDISRVTSNGGGVVSRPYLLHINTASAGSRRLDI